MSEKLWVAVDIGCIECGEESAVLGVFTDEGMAKVVTSEHQSRQSAGWTGQHEFMIFPVDDVNVEHRREYTR